MKTTELDDTLKALDGSELVRRAKEGLCYACGKKPAVGEGGIYCDNCTVQDFRKHL